MSIMKSSQVGKFVDKEIRKPARSVLQDVVPNGGIKFHLPVALLDESSERQNTPQVSMQYAKGWNDCLKIVKEELENNPKIELVWFKEQL